jgi:hypothetical protein
MDCSKSLLPKARSVQRKKRKNKKPITDNLFEDSEDKEKGRLDKVVNFHKISKDGIAGCHVGYLPQ